MEAISYEHKISPSQRKVQNYDLIQIRDKLAQTVLLLTQIFFLGAPFEFCLLRQIYYLTLPENWWVFRDCSKVHFISVFGDGHALLKILLLNLWGILSVSKQLVEALALTTKSSYWLRHVCPYVCVPQARLPMD
jgi:hypothetical protein